MTCKMRSAAAVLWAAAALWLAPGVHAEPELIAVKTVVGTARDLSRLDGEACPGMPNDRFGAFGSGIAWRGEGWRFACVADRGPLDGATRFRARMHEVTIRPPLPESPAVVVLEKTVLLSDERGRPLIGLASALDGSDEERFDPEAICIGPEGTVYIADEYGPTVASFDASGRMTKRFGVPTKFRPEAPGPDEKSELPPRNTRGRQPNRGFEGLAIDPLGKTLFALLQGPLLQDGALDDKGKRIGTNVRLLEMDIADGVTRERVYVLDDPKFGLNEISAVDGQRFLVIERDSEGGSKSAAKRVVLIDLAGASDVSAIESLPATGQPDGVRPVSKRTLIDLADSRFGVSGPALPAKVEGVTLGPAMADGRRLLVLISDNDMKEREPTWVYYFAVGESDLKMTASAVP